MLKRFLPKEDPFFDFFRTAVNQLVEITELYQNLLNYSGTSAVYVQMIQDLEEEGDKTIQAAFTLLHKTFITPFDRHDINRLTSQLDSLVDHIARSALNIQHYELTVFTQEIHVIVNLMVQSAKMAQVAIQGFSCLKNSAEVLKCCDAISYSEDTAQALILMAKSRLFKEDMDIRHLLKLREIYEDLRNIMERFQTLSNVIRTIVLEYA